jgi:hypothetical protein
MRLLRSVWGILQILVLGVNVIIFIGFIFFRFVPMLKINRVLAERNGLEIDEHFSKSPNFRYSPLSVWWSNEDVTNEIDYQIVNEMDLTQFVSRKSDGGNARVISLFLQDPNMIGVIKYTKEEDVINETTIFYKGIYFRLPLEKWRQQLRKGEIINLEGCVKDISGLGEK